MRLRIDHVGLLGDLLEALKPGSTIIFSEHIMLKSTSNPELFGRRVPFLRSLNVLPQVVEQCLGFDV